MKFEFYSFWGGFNSQAFINYFTDLFTGLEYETIQIWSVFGSEPQTLNVNPKILTVQWSGEPCYKNTNKYNINLIAKKTELNIIPCILAFCDVYVNNNIIKLNLKRTISLKTNFCNFIVSNGGPLERKQFFLELSKYKFVDSCGSLFKNWKGEPPPSFSSSGYHTFLNSWKFMICFENLKSDYYITEKITNAYLGGCIPIYWGCDQIKEIFNEKAILLLENNTPESVSKLIDKIIELDNDEELYLKMFNEPLFVNNELAKEFKTEYINEKIKLI